MIKDFDYLFYINYYEDLKKNNINNLNKALKHYTTNGINENRYYSKEHSKIFNENSWVLYRRNNLDLKNILNNDKDSFDHYMQYGKSENRKLYPLDVKDINKFNWDVFEHKFYNEINNLNLNNRKDSINHFKNIGRKLNLLFSIRHSNLYFNYDWDRYIAEYEDLNFIDQKLAFYHYLDYGKNENRTIFKKDDLDSKLKIFNWKFYLEFNSDLIMNNIHDKKKAIKHFKSVGFKENRLYSNYHYLLFINYDWKKYSEMYKLNKNDIESLKYYLSSGIKNNHKIFFKISEQNFYSEFFKNINNLQLNTFEECKNYYLNLSNKIPYSYEHYLIYLLFDWELMYYNNKDFLNTLEINNYNDFYKEYINNFEKFKIQLIINEKNIDTIINFEKIDELFINSNLINNIICFNLINNNDKFIHRLIDIQKKINDIISFNYSFIDIPPGFEFDEFIYENNDLCFTFVISSFNNSENIFNNLVSIVYQNYKNWKIYYTNDASTDNTHEKFNEFINKYNISNKVIYFQNEVNLKQAFCKNHIYKHLFDMEIVVLLDGDDWLAKNYCLSMLAKEYNESNNLIIYSNYHVYYNNSIMKTVKGNEYPIEVKNNKSYRTHEGWLFTHLKTGYAWLFKKIPDEYFKIDQNWLDRCTDLAEMYSAAEIAGNNVKHLDETFYVYNKQNSIKYNNSYYNDYNSNKRIETEKHVKSHRPLNLFLPKIFIINLKNRVDLKDKIINQMNNFSIKNYEFFEASNGYINKNIIDKYDEYNLKYNNNIISHVTLGVEKKHINSLGALGIIFSTIKLFKKINENSDLNHVLILEDDVYLHKDFKKLYQILNTDLYDKDFIYLGFNSTSKILNKNLNTNNIKFIKLNNLEMENGIYGAYSYICSRKYREFIISLGVDFYIKSNVNLDAAINIFINENDIKHKKNSLNFYIYNLHLFIPEVRKNGINEIRSDNFYKERFINLDNYLI